MSIFHQAAHSLSLAYLQFGKDIQYMIQQGWVFGEIDPGDATSGKLPTIQAHRGSLGRSFTQEELVSYVVESRQKNEKNPF